MPDPRYYDPVFFLPTDYARSVADSEGTEAEHDLARLEYERDKERTRYTRAVQLFRNGLMLVFGNPGNDFRRYGFYFAKMGNIEPLPSVVEVVRDVEPLGGWQDPETAIEEASAAIVAAGIWPKEASDA